jgi:cytidine deaminase
MLSRMNPPMTRRQALSTLGMVGLGWMALRATPVWETELTPAAGLEEFSPAARTRLRRLLGDPAFRGVIPAGEAQALVETEGKDADVVMIGLIALAKTFSRPPISGFRVGAVARGTSGALYLGANIELAGQPLGFAVHAEQSALANAYMHGEKGLMAVATSSAPCGHCRQFLYEASPKGEMGILQSTAAAAPLAKFLPGAFGPADLGAQEGMFPVRETELKLAEGEGDSLATAALEAARKSYAPYSKSPAGVALVTTKGGMFRGSYLENAAFNPSLSPLQVALVGLVFAGEDFAAISRAFLLEVDGALVSQRSATEAVLRTLAPNVRLEVGLVRPGGEQRRLALRA